MASASWKTCGLPKIEPHNISDEVLVTWIPRWNKEARIVSTAIYIPYHWCTDEDMGWNTDYFAELEYCEEQDAWWLPCGWYETTINTIDDCSYVKIDGEVIAWDNMPKPYKPKLKDFSTIEQEGSGEDG